MAEEEAIDRIVDKVVMRLSLDERMIRLAAKVEYLELLVIQDRALAVYRRIRRNLEHLAATNPTTSIALSNINRAAEITEREINRLLGAIIETDDPKRVYEQYLETLRKDYALLGLDNLVRAHDELPEYPPHSQA